MTSVPVSANTTYVASYHTVTGGYSATLGQLGAEVLNGPLTALRDGVDGGNGVYRYGAKGFPTNTYGSTSYAVDVVFDVPPDTTAPTVVSTAPGDGATSVPTTVAPAVTFSEKVEASTVSVTLSGPSGAVQGSLSLDPTGTVATFSPSAPLAESTSYTLTVASASDGAGNALASASTATFTTSGLAACPCSIFASDARPATAAASDPGSLELGTRFTPQVDGWIEAVRFYKGNGSNATHTGHLWSSTGALLATAEFTGESAGGWQTVSLSQPVAVTAGSTYTVSYSAPDGLYAATPAFYAPGSWVNGPLTAPVGGNGVFTTSLGAYPNQSWNNSNYWVDVVFTTIAPPDTTPPTVTAVTPVNGSTSVPVTAGVSATFSEAVQPTSVQLTLRTAGGASVAGTTSYDAQTDTTTFTPSSDLANGTAYTATVEAATDQAGNALASPYGWTFTTAQAPGTGCPCSIWADSTVPAVPDVADNGEVELGLKFRTDQAGQIMGARFYKGTGNTGTHVATLWSAAGVELATATFTGESASGWQEVSFAQPITVAADTTYVISYHAPVGHYSVDLDYFATSGADSGPLHGLASGVAGANGLYAYGTRSLPTQSYRSSNYWVDVVFAAGP